VRAIRDDDDDLTDKLVHLSRSRRAFAPLALIVGAFAMLVEGLRMLLSNWRLLLIQIPPAALIWVAMYDLKAHVLHGASFRVIRGPVLIPIWIAIVAITVASFFLNAVFAFSIAGRRPPDIRSAARLARRRWRPVLAWGVVVGLALALATTVAPRWQAPWFALTLGPVVGVMMLTYVAVPSRLIGAKPQASRRDRLTASFLSGALAATVCTPPYLLGRAGILMLGTSSLVVPGVLVLVIGFSLQAGATGAVRAVKLGAALLAGKEPPEARLPPASPAGG
jgi:hypothetical protein